MKKLFLLFYFYLYANCFSQNANLILQVNGKIITSDFANTYLKFDLEENYKIISVNYLPGNLSIPEEAWKIINSKPEKKFFLHLDYYTYKDGTQKITNFDIELSKYLIGQKYLIADIYDFRDKSYKRKFQHHTNKHFLVQFYYRPENGVHGLYVPRK